MKFFWDASIFDMRTSTLESTNKTSDVPFQKQNLFIENKNNPCPLIDQFLRLSNFLNFFPSFKKSEIKFLNHLRLHFCFSGSTSRNVRIYYSSFLIPAFNFLPFSSFMKHGIWFWSFFVGCYEFLRGKNFFFFFWWLENFLWLKKLGKKSFRGTIFFHGKTFFGRNKNK